MFPSIRLHNMLLLLNAADLPYFIVIVISFVKSQSTHTNKGSSITLVKSLCLPRKQITHMKIPRRKEEGYLHYGYPALKSRKIFLWLP